jgi:riboflavin synthase
MFTGIIQKVGTVKKAELSTDRDLTRLLVASAFTDLEAGESIAINGVCLTVTEFTPEGDALFFVSPETLNKTALGLLREGSRVNLERAVTLNTRLSGHLVQGHVDGIGKLTHLEKQTESFALRFEIPAKLSRYCVEKGSISINGVSLTINQIEHGPTAAFIDLTLIPHTWNHTQFSQLALGDSVNIEVDVLAKYVESLNRYV